jgi:cytochrome c-type biogenesis protein CcmF
MITADNFSIYIAFTGSVLSFVCYLVLTRIKNDKLSAWANRFYIASVIGTAYAAVYLLQQILSGARYDIAYIHDYSGLSDPLLYKISSVWAGQEGSLLVWTLFVGIIGIALSRKQNPLLMAFWASVQSFFLILLIMSDPFRVMQDFQSGSMGAGLNPLLKNPWMAIHPPVIFVGYAALVVPAAYAVSALIKGDAKNWVKRCAPWALFGWVSLSGGIILGMVWSYEVLGWGGFWGWDPVENASLVPWLTSTALVHGLLLQRYKSRNVRGNIILALSTFLLVLYAAFLTRSGVLSNYSVHSFADLGTYGYLLAFLLTYFILSAVLVVFRLRTAASKKSPVTHVSRDLAISLGMIVTVIFAVLVAVGTSFPLFAKYTLDPEFYTKMSIPAAITSVLLIIVASSVGWSRSDGKIIVRSKVTPTAFIAHCGFFLMIVGIVLSSTGKTANLSLVKNGQSKNALGYELSYKGIHKLSDTKDRFDLILKKSGVISAVPINIEYSERGAVRSPHIRSSLSGDLYISPGEVVSNTVTPVASMTERGWAATPYAIPGTGVTVTLIGMQVESHLARLEYSSGKGMPVEIVVSQDHPATVDGYTFTFDRFVSSGGTDMRTMSAGVQLGVTGKGITEKVTIQVSKKPFIWVLWLGTVLILIGGILAIMRSVRKSNGLLPDND